MNWLTQTLIWYFYLLALGIIFLPLTKRIFPFFYDRGYPFAKTLGIIITSYVLFILGLIHILPFTREAIFLVLLVIGFFIYRKTTLIDFSSWQKNLTPRFWFIAFEEALFIVALIFLAFVRGHEPSIHGLEKFMDFGFINSVLRSSYFPPLDMWLSASPEQPGGFFINYYYFGHLTGAFLIKFSGLLPEIGYNLILATIFAQGITLAFSLTANLIHVFNTHVLKKAQPQILHLVLFGLLGSFLVNLAGNLHPIYLLTNGYPNEQPLPFWSIFQSMEEIQKTMIANNQGFITALIQNSKYWYPNATRFIPFTIHEFPSYSYVVADLHGHVFDIPFVLVTIALLFTFFAHVNIKRLEHIVTKDKKKHKDEHLTQKSADFHMNKVFHLFGKKKRLHVDINLSKYEVGMTAFIGFMIAIHYMTNVLDGPIYILLTMLILLFLYQISFNLIALIATLGASFIVFALPFSINFSPFVSGIGVNCGPQFLIDRGKIGPFLAEQGNCQVSQPWMLFILWGFFWINVLLFMIVLFVKNKNIKKDTVGTSYIDLFTLALFALGTLLIVIPEFFYVKDIYPAHFRANTMFKLGYQAFIMMSIGSAFVLYRIKIWQTPWRFALKTVYFFLFGFLFIYPFLAFPSYYPGIMDSTAKVELDGSKWLLTSYPEDKEMIDYIQKYIKDQPIILEAAGDSYTDYERISAYTGLPTVAGWWVHEWLWRGSADVIGNRLGDVSNIYESSDVTLTKQLLNKYQVSYVVIGTLERNKYPNLNEEKFDQIGTKIFESSNGFGALYKIK